jgi:pimeloyl-ACP methyl ester carboxylesterase
MQHSYLASPTLTTTGSNGIVYAYRRQGPVGGRPLVLLQHFRGNLDNWDPELIDALSTDRDVVTFDNVGVAASSGTTPTSFAQMAEDAIVFVESLGLDSVDVLGFSIGSFVAQEIALTRSALVNRLVLASTAPQGAPGMYGWAADIIGAVGVPAPDGEGILHAFFTDSDASRSAGGQFLGRIFSRPDGRDEQPSWQTRNAQYDAVLKWGTPNFGLLQRLTAVRQPTFVANGDSDKMILPWYSHLVAALIPGAEVRLYSDAGHGFLFQHAGEFAADVNKFLGTV